MSDRFRTGEIPDRLTSREVDVLRLVAGGLTNRDIADRLGLSSRTVDAHLRSIYGKIAVSSRSGATRYAVERGLVEGIAF
ncbi:MAG: LuxR C-terminal-related transcriptional regulator [Candidatus Dormibacteraeota bacterium]|nr:LuxR C-terminal-related transcriptional regulator [Candidatus Dormibacteraeota bacterium]